MIAGDRQKKTAKRRFYQGNVLEKLINCLRGDEQLGGILSVGCKTNISESH